MILSAECNREKRVKKYGEIVEIIINTYNRDVPEVLHVSGTTPFEQKSPSGIQLNGL
jgi:hypothetical protein